MIEQMDTPDTRGEFERRFHILREQIMNGKLMLPRGSMALLGLMELRHLPNGRLDFLSVNEFARLQANMANQMAGMMQPPSGDEPGSEGDSAKTEKEANNTRGGSTE
jgi:hypothetical protein